MVMNKSLLLAALAALALGGCQTGGGINEGPVEYAGRPDYRDAVRAEPRYGGRERAAPRREGRADNRRYADPCLADPDYDPAYDRCTR